MLLFFAPVSLISLTDDRKKANICERKRTLPVHASFAFAENMRYFAHLRNGAYSDEHFARHYCAYDGASFNSRYNEYNCVILTCHYCAYNGMAFMARHTRYDAGYFCRIIIARLVTLILRRVISRISTILLAFGICALG